MISDAERRSEEVSDRSSPSSFVGRPKLPETEPGATLQRDFGRSESALKSSFTYVPQVVEAGVAQDSPRSITHQ